MDREVGQMRRAVARLGPWAALSALALAVTWPVTLGGKMLFWGVVSFQFVPWYRTAAALWRAGAIPLWNPWAGGGAPLLANYQVAALYPPTWLMIAVSPERALGWLIAGHLLLAGAGMYAWGRARGLSRTAALIGALALQGCGYLTTRAGIFPSIVFTFAWIPVWLWRAERLAQRSDRRRAVRLAIVIGLGLLAGHAQTAAYGLLMVGLYLGWRGWTEGGRTPGRLWAWGSLGLALGAGLATVQLFPTAAYMQASVRAEGLAEEALIYSFWPMRLLTFVAPDFFGHPARGDYVGYPTYWEGAGYVGLAPLLLALGLLLRPPAELRREVRFWGAVGGAALLLAMGRFLPGYEAAFDAMPILRIFNAPARRLMITEVALAVLAALATEHWLNRRPKRWQALPLLIGLVLTTVSWATGRAAPGLVTFASATLQAGVILTAWGGLALLRGRARQDILAAGLVILALSDLGAWGLTLLPTVEPDFYRACASPALAQSWRQEPDAGRILFAGTRTVGPEYDVRFTNFRLDDWRPPMGGWQMVCETLLPNLGELAAVPFADNEDPLRLDRWERLEALATSHPHLLPLLGVSHRLDVTCAPGETEVAAGAGLHLCRAGAAPRAWIVPQARQVPAGELPAALADAGFRLDREVLLETPPPLAVAGGNGDVIRLRNLPNSVTIDVRVDGPTYLVLADAWDAGWEARLDGAPVPLLRADLALRAVFIPQAGEHRVLMHDHPRALDLGALCSGLCVLALTLLSWKRAQTAKQHR